MLGFIMLTVNKKISQISVQQSGFILEQQGTIQYMQPQRIRYFFPLLCYFSVLFPQQRRGNPFIEAKSKLGGVITKDFLLCFVKDTGLESSPFWPPYFTLNEVSVNEFFTIIKNSVNEFFNVN